MTRPTATVGEHKIEKSAAKPDVAILCEWPTLNGGERSMLSTLAGIQAAGLKIVVIAPGEGPLAAAFAEQHVEVVLFSWRNEQGARRPLPDLRHALAEVLAQLRPRLLHANSLSAGVVAGPVAAALGLPSIAHLRDIINLSRQAIVDLNCHTRLLAVSQATRAHHVGRGLDAEKTHVLYNGVDLERFLPRPPSGWLHHELGLPADVPLVATIGQIGLRKGQDTLLAALAACGAERAVQDPHGGNAPRGSRTARPTLLAHCLIIGEQNSRKDEACRYVAALHDYAAAHLPGRVHFLGVRPDVDRVLNELTLLVHPARQEPLGRVLLEAAAAGVAIIATDVGGTREILPPGSGAGRLVPPDDVGQLSAAIAELLDNPTERATLAAAARRRAEATFDVRRAVPDLLRHYGEVAILDFRFQISD